MARADINKPTVDPIVDEGSVLYSFIMTERTYQEVELSFVEDITQFTVTASFIEANNVLGVEEVPDTVKPGATSKVLTCVLPVIKGDYDPAAQYEQGDYVSHNGSNWRAEPGTSNAVTLPEPSDAEPKWAKSNPNTVQVLFDETLGKDFAVQPTVTTPVYGFFQLKLTQKSTKAQVFIPVRGVVALHYAIV